MYVCKVDITTPPKFYRYILDGSITREFIDIFKYDGRVGYIIKRQLNKEKNFGRDLRHSFVVILML